jgi:hypothetical protein
MGIGGSRRLQLLAGDHSRGGASPVSANLGASGVKTTRAWVWEVQLGMGNPPRGFARVCGGCSDSRHGTGGSVQRSSTALGNLGAPVAKSTRA